MKYAAIHKYIKQYPVSLMCRMLEVSRSGYYKWLSRGVGKREAKRNKFEVLIKDTYEEFQAMYGARRIARELNSLGFICSENYVAQIMHENQIRALNGKGFKYPQHSLSMTNVSENLLWRDFKASGPNKKWTSDITYVWVGSKWMYLAVVMDLFSRKIIGWAFGATMTEDLVIEALSVAFARRGISNGENLIIHSDRGVQYRFQKYIDFARSRGCELSMSRKGNCWDNAPMESFFSRLKVELIYRKNFQTPEEVRAGLFEYIEIFYNRKRRHSSIDYRSPVEYERMVLGA